MTSTITATWARGGHLGQFFTYLLSVGGAAAAALVWLLLWKLLVPRTSERFGKCLSAAAAMGVVLWAIVISPLLGVMVAATLVGATILATEPTGPPTVPGPLASRATFLIVMLSETLAFCWGLWLVLSPRRFGFLMPLICTAGVITTVYLAARRGGVRLARVVTCCAPMLLLPLLGLWRAPSAGWLVVALLTSVAIAIIARPTPRTPPALVIAALWSMGAIAMIPLQMREARSINAASHEAFHLGWVNSALHHRFLGADSGTMYGILREYLITGYCVLFGATSEHIRMAHVLLSLAGALVCLACYYALFSHRPLLLGWLWYLAVFFTPLRNFCDYDLRISLGWADALRMFGALGAVVATCLILARVDEADRLRASVPRGLLFGCGTLVGLCVLYSQEFGLCAVGSVLLAPLAAYVFQHRRQSFGQRVGSALQSVLTVGAGVAAPLLAVLGLYAYFGKARLLLRSTWATLALNASGAFGSFEFPIDAHSFEQPEHFFSGFFSDADPRHDANIEYIVPVIIYVVAACFLIVRAVNGRWSARSTVLFGVIALGISSFRVSLNGSEIDHLVAVAAPCIVALGILVDESVDLRLGLGEGLTFPIGRVVAGAIVLSSVVMIERVDGVGHQLDQLGQGKKTPLPNTPHFYADLPRAGDVYLDEDFQALARFVHRTTAPSDKIYALLWMMDGGELYFLCDRANPTRYDLLAEIMTAEQQREVLESLKSDPPRLIIGKEGTIVGDEVIAYVNEHWSVLTTIGRYSVWTPP